MKGATIGMDVTPVSWQVSIHAPNEGSDLRRELNVWVQGVSIHAPNEGSD